MAADIDCMRGRHFVGSDFVHRKRVPLPLNADPIFANLADPAWGISLILRGE